MPALPLELIFPGRRPRAQRPRPLPPPSSPPVKYVGDAGTETPGPQSDESMRSVKLRQPRARRAVRRHASPFLGGCAVGDEGLHAALGRSVIIVGTGSLQNKLLASLIEQRTGYACSTRLADQLNGSLPATSLALIDAAEFAMRMQALCVAGLFQSLALINADEHLPLELVVACPGMKGVFFAESSEDTLVKGIEAIFRGEYWLPRCVLCAHPERPRTGQKQASTARALLVGPVEEPGSGCHQPAKRGQLGDHADGHRAVFDQRRRRTRAQGRLDRGRVEIFQGRAAREKGVARREYRGTRRQGRRRAG